MQLTSEGLFNLGHGGDDQSRGDGFEARGAVLGEGGGGQGIEREIGLHSSGGQGRIERWSL
jgi:hypothetical protein